MHHDSPGTLLRRHATPAVVVAIGLACTVAAALYVRQVLRLQQETRFRELVTASTTSVGDRMDGYVAMLRATRGLFEGLGRDPTAGELGRFVASLDLAHRYPGTQGIGWARAIAPDELEAHEAEVRRSGQPGYRVWPPGPRDRYTSIVLLEPLDWRNQRAIGFDMYSEPTRRAAMERARDGGQAAASGRVELVQEAGDDRQAGFLVYLPVYAGAPRTPGERERLLRGWVYAPFRSADLFHGTLGEDAAKAVGLAVYDAAEPRPDALLYDAGARTSRDARTVVTRLEVSGRTWALRFAANGAFASGTERALPLAVVAVGLSLTALLFWVTREEARARRRAEASAGRSAFLAEAGTVLGSSLEYADTLGRVARLSAERFADACVVYVAEPEGPLWRVGHRDAALADRATVALQEAGTDPEAQLGGAAALRTGRPQVVHDVDTARLRALSRTPGLASLVRDAGVRALLTVPLVARGEPLGAVTLVSADRGRRFGPEDVALAEDLGRLAVAAIDTGRLYRRAQEAVQDREDFISIASHELKTPLTSLLLQSDSLRVAARRGRFESVPEKAEVIRRNVERLSRLVASLLDLSRIASGRMELELERVDLAEVARDVIARFEEEARRAGCTVGLDAPAPVVGRWDRLGMDQVATNLLSNAVKYGAGAPVEVRVAVREEGRAVLSVRDHGIGISAPDQRRIFGRFERAVSKRHYGGFGLGLWIVRQIVEAQGGAVSVESVPGEGSTFTVSLPRETSVAPRVSASVEPRAP